MAEEFDSHSRRCQVLTSHIPLQASCWVLRRQLWGLTQPLCSWRLKAGSGGTQGWAQTWGKDAHRYCGVTTCDLCSERFQEQGSRCQRPWMWDKERLSWGLKKKETLTEEIGGVEYLPAACRTWGIWRQFLGVRRDKAVSSIPPKPRFSPALTTGQSLIGKHQPFSPEGKRRPWKQDWATHCSETCPKSCLALSSKSFPHWLRDIPFVVFVTG